MESSNLIKCGKCLSDKCEKEIERLQCNHSFCLLCLEGQIKMSLEKGNSQVICIEEKCDFILPENIIEKIISSECFCKYSKIMIKNKYPNEYFECLLEECKSCVLIENKEINFECKECSLFNCDMCKEPHAGYTCKLFNDLSEKDAKAVVKFEKERASKNLSKIRRESIVESSKSDLLACEEIFYCNICSCDIIKKDGVKLRNCFHTFCREDLNTYISSTNERPVRCPEPNCQSCLEDREIKALLSEQQLEFYETSLLKIVIPKLSNYFKCQSPNCNYFCELNNKNVKRIKCRNCKTENCVKCSAIHPNISCKKYQEKNEFIEKQIKERKLMRCPECKTLLKKEGGCNWIKCTECLLELCWIKQMRRWGPKGFKDTSGGCKCDVNGKRCHPDCKEGCTPDFY